MRSLFTMVVLFYSLAGSGQTETAIKQARALFDDAPSGFKQYTGRKKTGTDTISSLYNSTIHIEGTTDDDIFKDSSGVMYSANISDFVSRREAQKINREWLGALEREFGRFKQLKGLNYGNRDIVSYNYRQGCASISLDIVAPEKRGNCLIIIHISCYPQ